MGLAWVPEVSGLTDEQNRQVLEIMTSVACEDWFEICHLSDGVSLIREKHIAHWLRCNIWFIQGEEKNLVIDSGMGLSPLTPVLIGLSELPVTAVMTHCHFDHMGGAHEFERRLGHRACSDAYHEPMRCFEQIGGAAFVRAETFKALPYSGFTFESYEIRPAPLTGYLDEGDVIDLGNRVFQVFYLPGHSPDSIALWEKETGLFFSGDTIYDGDLYDTVYHSNRQEYRQSLQRLRELPISTVHGGHFDSFGNQRMQDIIERYMEGKGRLTDAFAWVEGQV
jgi:glyoxylase-like metal-dependent hydrolase (beta-lactamase superfamily II)|tara:strand:+ start:5044 stop:5883 length:840 start_codon:yes stop_codon:yes gene_type:complete